MNITKLQKNLAAFAAASSLRLDLAGVKTDGKTAVATDSYRLVECVNEEAEADEAVILDAKDLKKHKIEKGCEQAQIEKTDGGVFITSGNTRSQISIFADAEAFPQYEALFAEAAAGDCVEVSIDGKLLAEVLAYMGTVDAWKHVVVLRISRNRNSAVHITAKGDGHSVRALVMPIMSSKNGH